MTDTTAGISWAPGEILLRPNQGFVDGVSPARLVIGFTAPVAGTISGSWTFTKAATSGSGDGVGYQLIRNGATTPLQEFGSQSPATTTDSPISSSVSGLSFSAGDTLYWRVDSWAAWLPGTNDITKAVINMTAPWAIWSNGASGNWSTGSNWVAGGAPISATDMILFRNSSGGSSNNDIASLTAAGLQFLSGAGSFTVSGSALTLSADVTNASTSAQTLGLDLVLGGTTRTFNAVGRLTVNGAISDGVAAAGITKTGSGMLTLSGNNTYSGTTTVSAGRLVIAPTGQINSTSGITINGSGAELKYNSATALTRPITFAGSGGTLSGTGVIGSALSLGTNAVLSPGNSPGILTGTAGVAWNPGGTYAWELNALAGTAGTNWDLLSVTAGGLDLSTLSTTNRFTLDLITLTGSNTSGPLDSGYVAGPTYEFLIASFNSLSVPGTFSNTANSILTGLFTINLGNWQGTKPSLSDMSVKVNSAGTGISLVIVPEPGAVGLAGAGIAIVAWATKRSRRRASK